MAECRYYEMCALRASIRNLPRSCGARHCWMFRPMPDVDALLALADDMRRHVAMDERSRCHRWVSPEEAVAYADRIREALGVVA